MEKTIPDTAVQRSKRKRSTKRVISQNPNLPPLPEDATAPEQRVAFKQLFLENLLKCDGMPYHAADATKISARVIYIWKKDDLEFSKQWDAVVVEAERRLKEDIKKQVIGITRGEKGFPANAHVMLMFASKALAGLSDQPKKGATSINVSLPGWISEKLEARRVGGPVEPVKKGAGTPKGS